MKDTRSRASLFARCWLVPGLILLFAGACKGDGDGGTEEPTPATVEEPTPAEEPTAAEEPADPAALSPALTSALARVPDGDRDRQLPADVDIEAGRTTFDGLCAACHGAGGAGDGPAAKMLDPGPGNLGDPGRNRRTTVGQKAWIVTHGVGGGSAMPPFDAALSKTQIWNVVAVIEDLVPPPEEATDAAPEEPPATAAP